MRGLKYDQKSDIFTARYLYKVLNKDTNEIDEIEEKMVVTEEWVKRAGFAKGVVEHVISMDSGCGLIPVPEGVEIVMNTRKVLRVKYVQPTSQWCLDVDVVHEKAKKLVEEEKQELLKTIAIESGKQVVAEASPSPKRRRKCTQDKISPDYRRKEINNIPMRDGYVWRILASHISRQFKAHANR